MTKFANSKALVEAFLAGQTEGFSGSSLVLSNIRIKGNQIVHFQTPILERAEDGAFILNLTGYSAQTKRLQETIQSLLEGKATNIVRGVPQDYGGSLKEFL